MWSPEPSNIVAQWVADEAWGHHASCSAKIGGDDDPMAVLDEGFVAQLLQPLRDVHMLELARVFLFASAEVEVGAEAFVLRTAWRGPAVRERDQGHPRGGSGGHHFAGLWRHP